MLTGMLLLLATQAPAKALTPDEVQRESEALEASRPSLRGAAGTIAGGGIVLGGLFVWYFASTDMTLTRDATHPLCDSWGIFCASPKHPELGTVGNVLLIAGATMMVAGLTWLLVDVIIDKVIAGRIEALSARP